MAKLNIKKIRGLRWVRRFNFHQCNHYMSVAEHSYFVAVIGIKLSDIFRLDQWQRLDLIRLGLVHDMPECVTGDVPFLIRRHLGDIMQKLDEKAIDEIGCRIHSDSFIKKLIALADALELKMYLEEERKSGNVGVLLQIEAETMRRICDILDSIECTVSEYEQVLDMIEVVKEADLPVHLSHEGSSYDQG